MKQKDEAVELQLARDMEADCTIGAGAGFGKYTPEVAEERRAVKFAILRTLLQRGPLSWYRLDAILAAQGFVMGPRIADAFRALLYRQFIREEQMETGPVQFTLTERGQRYVCEGERIVAAAIRYGDAVYTVPPPGRHHNVCHLMAAAGLEPETMRDQGFVTSTGRFVDRHQAAIIARSAQQLLRKTNPTDLLFSEDVW